MSASSPLILPVAPNLPVCSIGLFDSGLGGLSVLQEVRQALPNTPLIYLADQAHCPYGPRSDEDIVQLSNNCTRWLLAQGARLIVVACNSASAAALEPLRAAYPAVPFVGMVPAVKPAAKLTQTGVVGVLATHATIQGELLNKAVEEWAQGVKVVTQVGTGLVELVEHGMLQTPAARQLVQSHLQPLLDAGVDVLVLGCTHYPFLRPIIAQLAPQLTVLDSGAAIARRTLLLWQGLSMPDEVGDASVRYATTGALASYQEALQRFELPSGYSLSIQL